MTSDFLSGLNMIFKIGWDLLTSFYIPGTNVTPAGFMLFVVVSGLSLKFLLSLFGVGGASSSNVFHAERSRAGRSKD